MRKFKAWAMNVGAALAGLVGLTFSYRLVRWLLLDGETREEVREAKEEVRRLEAVRDALDRSNSETEEQVEILEEKIERVQREAVELVQKTESMDAAQVAHRFRNLGY